MSTIILSIIAALISLIALICVSWVADFQIRMLIRNPYLSEDQKKEMAKLDSQSKPFFLRLILSVARLVKPRYWGYRYKRYPRFQK